MTGSKDKQSYQIKSELQKLSSTGKLKILDYGIGKGRLISNINDTDIANSETLIKNIDYVGFDEFDTDKESCENNIKKAYGHSTNRYFNDWEQLLTFHEKESFHIVIMCNVLHEIPPEKWLDLFSKNGKVSRLLHNTGILLLVEDQQLSIGEKAYQKGFLVLDTPHLKELFKMKNEEFLFNDKDGKGRLKAHHIPKECLTRIDADSRCKAINSLAQTAKDKIIAIRKVQKKDYSIGKLHGFWTQQFANAHLNLAELCG